MTCNSHIKLLSMPRKAWRLLGRWDCVTARPGPKKGPLAVVGQVSWLMTFCGDWRDLLFLAERLDLIFNLLGGILILEVAPQGGVVEPVLRRVRQQRCEQPHICFRPLTPPLPIAAGCWRLSGVCKEKKDAFEEVIIKVNAGITTKVSE